MTQSLIRLALPIAVGLALTGCNNLPTKLSHSQEFAPVYPSASNIQALPTGAIYSGRGSDMWFGRGRAYVVGDLITVLLNESTQASREQKGDITRKNTNDIVPQRWSDRVGVNLNSSNITSSGAGTADQTASLTGSIAVTVVEVLANGNMMVRGEKQLALTEGSEVIQVSGIVRPEDISPNGTVQSRRLANAQIAYRGTGDMASAVRPGWGTNLLIKLWPF